MPETIGIHYHNVGIKPIMLKIKVTCYNMFMDYKKVISVGAMIGVITSAEPLLSVFLPEYEKVKQQHSLEKEMPFQIIYFQGSNTSASVSGIPSIKYNQY